MKIHRIKMIALGTLVGMLSSFFVVQAQTQIFPDVPVSHPYYSAITYLYEIGTVSGNPDGTFAPEATINRAAVLKMMLEGSTIAINENVASDPFPDVPSGEWFAKYVSTAKDNGIVQGNDLTGLFEPGKEVIKAEFLKMLLETYGIRDEALQGLDSMASDVPDEAWFAPYMNYALSVGIDVVNKDGLAQPGKILTRAEVAHMVYMLNLIIRGEATQFLLDRAGAEMSQIEIYIAVNDIASAKRSSELAYDLASQASSNMPDDMVALGAARLGLAYDQVVDAFIYGVQKNNAEAEKMANLAIDTATSAWEANNDLQMSARHIKDVARSILEQVGGIET